MGWDVPVPPGRGSRGRPAFHAFLLFSLLCVTFLNKRMFLLKQTHLKLVKKCPAPLVDRKYKKPVLFYSKCNLTAFLNNSAKITKIQLWVRGVNTSSALLYTQDRRRGSGSWGDLHRSVGASHSFSSSPIY